QLFDNWFDPIEAGLRDRAREFLQAMLEAELDEVLDRSRYARRAKRSTGDLQEPAGVSGHRHGHRSRTLLGTFGQLKIEVPRARLDTPDGKTTEWKSGSTDKRPRSHCWSYLGCAPTAKRCFWQSRTWAARVQKPGGRCSTISSS